MGISLKLAHLLIEAIRDSRAAGSILTLGVQDCFFTTDDLKSLLESYSIDMPQHVELSQKTDLRSAGYISPKIFFAAMGFEEYCTLDASDYEGCDFIFDLNDATAPSELHNRFNFIFDGGTLEHIFHIPNALNNLGQMLKHGGAIYHISPSSNYIDHGFYTFSPTFFLDYYSENNWDLVELFLMSAHRDNLYGGKYLIYDYDPERLIELSMGGLDDQMYHTICVARKNQNSTTDKIPQQGKYKKHNWLKKDQPQMLEEKYRLIVKREI